MGAGWLFSATPCTHHIIQPAEQLRESSPGELATNSIQKMNSKHRRTKFSRPSLLLLLSGLEILLSLISLSTKSPTAAPCASPEYHEFDFWLGDWDSFNIADSTKDARVRVERILDGCVIHEDYQSVEGHKGESFSIYDASRKVWHQSWVTNRGQLLIIEGHMQDGAIVLAGTDRTASGEERRVRGIWKPVDGGVRETAFTSTDAGKTWKPWFDLMFRPPK